MSTSERNAYHHGDLKAALLRAARALLDEGGAAAVSLREAARQAGVSPTAAYRHFADKDAMLAALAAQGFEAFGQALQAALASAQPASAQPASAQPATEATLEPMAEMGVAYVRFAVAHPGMFRLMFGPHVADRSRSPELMAALAGSTRAFEHGMATRTDITGDPRVEAVRAWALVHGLAMLVLDGMVPGLDAEGLARAVLGSPKPGAASAAAARAATGKPIQDGGASSAPAQTPSRRAPAGQSPAKRAPAQNASAKKAPAKKAGPRARSG